MTYNIFLPIAAKPAQPSADHPHESALLAWLQTHPAQRRPVLRRNATLMAVAKAHVLDMIGRDFFGHTNPDGSGPNERVRRAGFRLPAHYGTERTANNVESLAGGYETPEAALAGWLGSPAHRAHVLGEREFFRAQTEMGVGYAYHVAATYNHYFSVVIAEAVQVSGE
jgi:uncharacterized protein YkwD